MVKVLSHDFYFVILCFLIVLFVFVLFLIFNRKRLLSKSTARNLAHISGGLWALIWWFFIFREMAFLVCIFVSLTILLLEAGGKKTEWLLSPFVYEDETSLGLFLYPFSMGIVTLLFWKDKGLGTSILLILSVGDALASIVGGRFGKKFYRIGYGKKKSFLGSGIFLFSSFSFIILGFAISKRQINAGSLLLAFLCSLLVAILEAVSPKNTDNLSVPIGASLFMKGVQSFKF